MSDGFFESFENGTGSLGKRWGNVDTSHWGEVTLTGYSGLMENDWGSWAGHGYGTYTVVAKMSGNQPGPAALLWPGDNRWPGSEIDLAEFIDGRPYGTMHWRGNNGGDAYNSVYYNGVDANQKHTYTVDWQEGHIAFSVDGREIGSINHDVPRDAAHGGTNEVFSIMNSNWNTSLTVYELSYQPHNDNAWS